MRNEAKRLRLNVAWGVRRAVLREIGVLGSFVARTLCDPPDADAFRREAERVLRDTERELNWMYQALDPKGSAGKIRYVVWSEMLACRNCGRGFTFWDGCVRRRPARINPDAVCPHCSRKTTTSAARRLTKATWDELLSETIRARVRRPVWIYGATGARTWSRRVEPSDRALLDQISKAPLPHCVPRAKVPWGDLYRSGYHQGITHLHHFYTRRNLITFATLWQKSSSSPLRDALRFWLLSYNASHATLMTRVVAKKGQADLVVTSSQPGVLYISGLPVEKNLFDGLRRKLNTISDAFSLTKRSDCPVNVDQGSCLLTDLPEQSVDYVFTDPPFGGNIPYAEVNYINEAWLGKYTATNEEITISKVQGKDVGDYETLMTQAFAEIRRILKDDAKASVVFHSSSAGVWNALQRAYTVAGLNVETASVLDKTQGSFKQVTTAGAVKGDPVLLLQKPVASHKYVERAAVLVVEELLADARASSDSSERTPQRLYSRFVTHFLTREQSVPLDAEDFYRLVAARSLQDNASSSTE
jgi:adenine-specific DNA methylase